MALALAGRAAGRYECISASTLGPIDNGRKKEEEEKEAKPAIDLGAGRWALDSGRWAVPGDWRLAIGALKKRGRERRKARYPGSVVLGTWL